MESPQQYHGDLGGYGVIMEIMYGGEGTPPSVVRPCEMDITFGLALNMCGSSH